MPITEQTEKRIISFVRQIANDCTICMRRSESNCEHCRSLWANSILTEVEADMEGVSKHIDYSLGARMEKILSILRKKNRPLLSAEIDLERTCSFQLKMWTLKKMIKRGIISRKIAKRSSKKIFYRYSLKTKETKKNENKLP